MYTLRKVNKENKEELNIDLGKMYTLVNSRNNADYFNKILEDPLNQFDKEVFAFIFDDRGEIHPLYEYERHYIMTENGSTFSTIY